MMLDIEGKLAAYRSSLTRTGKYASFDYCFNHFRSFHDRNDLDSMLDDNHLQVSCLQLGFYLASWGMFRGSSPLLRRSARHYVPVIEAIVNMPAPVWVLDANEYSSDNLAMLLDAFNRIRTTFPSPATDTLVTKTMLGVFGCVPAFDNYFKRGLSTWTFSRKSLLKIRQFYDENAAAIEANRVPTIAFETGLPTRHKYSRSKVIDMVFFIAGGASTDVVATLEPPVRD